MNIGTTTYFFDRKDWREWLEKNHNKESEIWLIYYKKPTGNNLFIHIYHPLTESKIDNLLYPLNLSILPIKVLGSLKFFRRQP